MHGASVDKTDAYFFHIDFLFPRRPISRIARDFDRSAESARRLPTRPLKGKIESRHADLHFLRRKRESESGSPWPAVELHHRRHRKWASGQTGSRKLKFQRVFSPPVVLDVASSTSCLWSYFSLLRVVFLLFFPAFLFCENVKCLFFVTCTHPRLRR